MLIEDLVSKMKDIQFMKVTREIQLVRRTALFIYKSNVRILHVVTDKCVIPHEKSHFFLTFKNQIQWC